MAIIIKPVVTEKATAITEKLNRYTLRVDKNANKVEIKKAIEEMYGVTVTSVNTAIMPSKKRSRFTKGGVINGKTSSYKKAIVTLKEGDKIDFYSNI
ncbi:50S ribosomal protein L23 [Microbacter margulisiae]|uniref:Large ribosomal subunit protein uL23 n=1 Tax=Microbacter margulisiae TaxID=1350067 RepID=A0A7W5DTR8_9PORP|nr:50S ribosomal protein L23 [Microbacter margulisiae]MBB3188083.1 large subunit ribosomal protein L23 [Microbacter margulisiae]